MSAIVGVFASPGDPADPQVAAAMLGAMKRRGADCASVRRVGTVVLGASRFEWELEPGMAGAVVVGQHDDVTIAADASLFYRDDLMRKLRDRGIRPLGPSPSQLIAAAYLAWGAHCIRELEGDFAFVLWDARTRSVLAARDFTGKRPLFYAQVGAGLLVASSLDALEAHPACPHELDLAVLAEEASALTGPAADTCWKGIKRLPPGHALRWRAGEAVHTAACWTAPEFSDRGGGSFDDAAAELRSLLQRAVSERLAAGPTGLCLSGGWDSPALYAVGQQALSADGAGRTLEALSVSFPAGDPGREDDVIESIVRHWNARATWVDSEGIPALDHVVERAARRAEPFPHPFEMMLRALARTGRQAGVRVVLDGNGGDQLFQVSDAFLADLFAAGRWGELAREWRARGGGARSFVRDALAPAAPEFVLRGVSALRGGRSLRDLLEPRAPAWIRPGFVRRYGLVARERAHGPRRGPLSRAAAESAWQLTRPLIGRMTAELGSFALEEGVEHRSPFLDERIVRFAAARPISDRSAGRETKRLLRHAVRGLLPDAVLAPRPHRTGTPIRYLTSGIRLHMPALIDETMRAPLLGDLGILDPAAFRRAWDESVRQDDVHACVSLYLTMEVELWLRGRPARGMRDRGLICGSRIGAEAVY